MNESTMSENQTRALRGDLYYAFTPELIAARRRCNKAVQAYNNAGELPRRQQIELWNNIVNNRQPLPPPASDPETDENQLSSYPWIETPIRVDYGTNLQLGENVYINANFICLDTCKVRIGSRTLIGPNVSLYAGTHPLDPEVRNGTQGPEGGGEIDVGQDVWICGSVCVCPGVKIGDGATVGAGSVVTKDVAPYTVVAGNPARYIKDVPRNTNAAVTSGALDALKRDEAKRS
ncbi:hypothetical protein MBLNU230_g4897t1 [Neophaeotheca triangularis]